MVCHQSKRIPIRLQLGAAAAAVTFALVLIVPSAGAQTFSVIHNFAGGQDGS